MPRAAAARAQWDRKRQEAWRLEERAMPLGDAFELQLPWAVEYGLPGDESRHRSMVAKRLFRLVATAIVRGYGGLHASVRDLADALGCSPREVRYARRILVRTGRLNVVACKRPEPWYSKKTKRHYKRIQVANLYTTGPVGEQRLAPILRSIRRRREQPVETTGDNPVDSSPSHTLHRVQALRSSLHVPEGEKRATAEDVRALQAQLTALWMPRGPS